MLKLKNKPFPKKKKDFEEMREKISDESEENTYDFLKNHKSKYNIRGRI